MVAFTAPFFRSSEIVGNTFLEPIFPTLLFCIIKLVKCIASRQMILLNLSNNFASTIESTILRTGIINQIRSCNIKCSCITYCFDNRVFTFKCCFPSSFAYFFSVILLLSNLNCVAASSVKLNTIIKSIEERSNTQCQHNKRNHISYFTEFNEIEISHV